MEMLGKYENGNFRRLVLEGKNVIEVKGNVWNKIDNFKKATKGKGIEACKVTDTKASQ